MSLNIKLQEKRPNVFHAEIKGAIDSETHMDLEKALGDVIKENTKALVLDMKGIDYVSSIGIRAIMWAKKTLEGYNASFSMVDMQPKIKNIFDMMKLLPIFDIFDDMPQADKFIDQMIEEELKRGSDAA